MYVCVYNVYVHHALRSEQHSPEGTLMIEDQLAEGSLAEPIFSFVHQCPVTAVSDMQFDLTAASQCLSEARATCTVTLPEPVLLSLITRLIWLDTGRAGQTVK